MVQETPQLAGNSMSPARISFSYDLPCTSDIFQTHLPLSPSSTATDFDFCVRKSCDQDSPSAAELFADGKIVPAEIRKSTQKPKTTPEIPETTKKESEEEEREKQGGNGRSFWGFKRSSSVSGYGYGTRLCPLPLLSRSNSTGSAGGSKRGQVKTTPCNGNYQKPPVKKSYGRVNPVLQVPVVNIFGKGSIFSSSSNGRDHKSKVTKK